MSRQAAQRLFSARLSRLSREPTFHPTLVRVPVLGSGMGAMENAGSCPDQHAEGAGVIEAVTVSDDAGVFDTEVADSLKVPL